MGPLWRAGSGFGNQQIVALLQQAAYLHRYGMKGYAGPWVCNGRVEGLMDTRVFAYVAKLADTGSYARAAQELFITKQGLASAIERLERSMGVPLFEADRKGVRLTEYGHVFCSFSRMFEERHRAMMDEIEQMRRREERAVTLAASTGLFNGRTSAHFPKGTHGEPASRSSGPCSIATARRCYWRRHAISRS